MARPVFKNKYQMRQLNDADLTALLDKHMGLARTHGQSATGNRHRRIVDAISDEQETRTFNREAASPYSASGIRVVVLERSAAGCNC